MTTTATAVRDKMILTLRGTTPVSISSDRFVAFDEQASDFRGWAMQNPAACFRRFSIRDLFELEEPRISDTVQEEVWTTFEVVIAYPTAGKGLYGPKMHLSLQTVQEQDIHKVRHAIGVNGYATLDVTTGGAATVTEDRPTVEPGDPVSFVVLNLRTRYLRAMS